MSRTFIQMMRAEYQAEMNGAMAKKASSQHDGSSLPEYDSDEETVGTVIQQTSWKSMGSSCGDISPGPSDSQSKSRKSTWWNLDEDGTSSNKSASATENKGKKDEDEEPKAPSGWRDPLDANEHCKSSKEKTEKQSTRFSWWNLGDEAPLPSSEAPGKVDAKVVITNIDKSLEKKNKKKTKSDKKKSSKTDKKKSSKTDKKKTKKTKRKEKKDKKELSASSAATESETLPQSMPVLSIEQIEQESETLEFDAAQAFKVNVRKLQTLVALEKCFEDNQTVVTKNSTIKDHRGDDESWW